LDGGFAPGKYGFQDDDSIPHQLSAQPEPSQPEDELLSCGPLSISTRLEYTSLRKDEMHNVFGLVSLQAAEAAVELEQIPEEQAKQEERTPVDIVCVLDRSGSMSGAKIQLVKDAVAFVITEMQPNDRLSLVSFHHGAERHTPLKKMTAEGKDTSQQAMAQIYASGGTSIANGLDCGIAIMEQRRQRNPVGAVFLLTDGQDSTSREQIQQLVNRARSVHCSVYAFGFGEDHNTTTLNAIAESAQTPFTYVERLDTIRNVFAGAVNGLMSVAAQGIELRIMPENGCKLTAIHTPFTYTRQEGEDSAATVKIPDAFEGERRDVVIELRVPAASVDGSVALLQASARYYAVRERAAVQTQLVQLRAERTAEPEGEPDAEVVEQRQRIEVTNALENSIAQCEQGHFDKAQEVLSQRAESLRRNSAQTPVSLALLAEVEDAQDRLKDEQAWKNGGHAEVSNAMWMHRQQRCTNTDESMSFRCEKSSKALYTNSRQRASIKRSLKW
jgi:Mg-chelatase subunit ChlD